MALPLIFTKSQNGLNDNKEPENMKYTRVKYGERFYELHKSLLSTVAKLNNTLKSNECTHRTENSWSVHVSRPDLISAN